MEIIKTPLGRLGEAAATAAAASRGDERAPRVGCCETASLPRGNPARRCDKRPSDTEAFLWFVVRGSWGVLVGWLVGGS